MRRSTRSDDQSSVWSGVAVAAAATLAWFLLVGGGTDLVNEEFFEALVLGSGALSAAGLLLVAARRTRRLGIGLAVGAPVALVIEVGVLSLLIMHATS